MARELTSIEPLLPVIRKQPFGVLSDIDGTLSPIVPRPEDATVPEAIRARYQYVTEAPMDRLRAAGYDRPPTPLAAGVESYVSGFLAAADRYR